ncbi:acyltransferase [uncultured Selenomonas sp.]|uniref:acyltransferase n=1 Tax=uncultured Selenomonas sp. TaxID=159275 RepID=UPI002805731F|nr:acyltransferase [uncultured Selenomonas sp.]
MKTIGLIIWHVWVYVYELMIYLFYGNNIKFGSKLYFRSGFTCKSSGGIITIGKHCFFNRNCSIVGMENIIIGDDCLFGENVKIYDHNHVFNKKGLMRNHGFKTKKVSIGSNCWIANNALILAGAKIGNNCVIGAGCVIDYEIPDNMIVRAEQKQKIEEIRFHE